MRIRKQRMGPLATNTYLVWDEESQEAILIDPAGKPAQITQILEGFSGKVKYILLTHGHPDHVAGLAAAKEQTGAPILIHRLDVVQLENFEGMVARYMGIEEPLPPADQALKGGETLSLGQLSFQVLHTPGHTEGGIVLFGHGVLFAGDTLFAGSIGRYDLPGGNGHTLQNSLQQLMALPADTKVYPGHGQSTTILKEKTTNRYIEER